MDSASVASGGMFEHVAKMSRINDRKPPPGAPPLRFRSAVVPLSEISDMSPSGDVINGSDVTAASKEAGNDRYNDVIQLRDGLPPIKLRTNVLGTSYSSHDPKDSPRSRRHQKDKLDANNSEALTNGNKKQRRLRQSKVEPERQSAADSEHSRRHSVESDDSEKGGKSRAESHASSRRPSLPDSETGNRQDSGRRSRSRRRKDKDESDAHATGSQKGTPERSQRSSRQPSRQGSLDASMTSSIEDKADKEKKLNKQRHRSRDRDNYDHREHERVEKENESESERYQQRPKKKHRGKGMTIKQINRVVEPDPTPPPSPAAKRMAEVRTQRWKKTTEINTDHIEDRKRGRNMRAAPRHTQASDDFRQVVTKEQILLDRLLRESTERKRDIDAETAAKQLIDTKYIEQEQVAHQGEEVELRRHIEHHLEHGGHHHHHHHLNHHSHHHSREHSKERSGKDKTQIECHLQTSLDTKKVTHMLAEAFPLAQITHAKIVHNGEAVVTPKSPKSSCGGYLSDATDASHARSAYDMILTQGSATGLRNYSQGDALPPVRWSHSRIGNSAPVSAGSMSVQSRSPRVATKGVWHGDSDADRNAGESRRVSKKASKRATSSSPRRSARSERRPSSARRSGSVDNLDKKALLEALQESLDGESKKAKPSRPFSAKR